MYLCIEYIPRMRDQGTTYRLLYMEIPLKVPWKWGDSLVLYECTYNVQQPIRVFTLYAVLTNPVQK